jgi:hypothetical protein
MAISGLRMHLFSAKYPEKSDFLIPKEISSNVVCRLHLISVKSSFQSKVLKDGSGAELCLLCAS